MRLILLLAVAVTASLSTRTAGAYKQFQDLWQDHYLENHADEEFATMVKKEAKCYVCHQGKKKSHCNAYGKLYIGLIGKADRRDDDKILAAIKEVGAKHVKDGDSSSPTYAELVAKSELPGGTLEEAKKEPADEK